MDIAQTDGDIIALGTAFEGVIIGFDCTLGVSQSQVCICHVAGGIGGIGRVWGQADGTAEFSNGAFIVLPHIKIDPL